MRIDSTATSCFAHARSTFLTSFSYPGRRWGGHRPMIIVGDRRSRGAGSVSLFRRAAGAAAWPQQAAVLFGVKAPTGNTDLVDRFGEIFEAVPARIGILGWAFRRSL